jgi:hypothetical protein
MLIAMARLRSGKIEPGFINGMCVLWLCTTLLPVVIVVSAH